LYNIIVKDKIIFKEMKNMDLYEALKNGASIEQLKGDFEKELNAAAAKVEKEDELSDAREEAVSALTTYLEVALGAAPTEEDANNVRKMFMTFEEEMAPLRGYIKFINGTVAPKKVSKPVTPKSDREVLREFLDKMKP
jgi:3-oxoacyl-ACP reductase-like protein